MQDFLGELLGLVFVEALIEGNVTSQEALELAKSVLELLPSRRLPITERPKDRIAHIPAGSSYLLRCSFAFYTRDPFSLTPDSPEFPID